MRPQTSLKTAWRTARARANIKGRFHDNRHTFVTDLAESGAGDEVIRDLAGHVSKDMLKHYSHIRTQAKRQAVEALVAKPPSEHRSIPERATGDYGTTQDSGIAPQDFLQVRAVN
jgi:integrase